MYANYLKRPLDLCLALLAIVLLAPVFVLIAVAIRMVDAGPAVLQQQRTGRQGKPFACYKFRSMPVTTELLPSDQIGKVQLTWLGRLLRRTNLDELPQLFNIVRGEMSFVGPRPSLPSQIELITLRSQNGALKCRPGLTGLTQVNAYDGMAVAHKAQLDGRYAADICFHRDLLIVFKTCVFVFKRPPVY